MHKCKTYLCQTPPEVATLRSRTLPLCKKKYLVQVTKPGYHWRQSAQSLEPVAAHPDLEAEGWAHSQADPRHFRVGFVARIFLGDTSASTSCACPRTPSGWKSWGSGRNKTLLSCNLPGLDINTVAFWMLRTVVFWRCSRRSYWTHATSDGVHVPDVEGKGGSLNFPLSAIVHSISKRFEFIVNGRWRETKSSTWV